MSRSLTTSLVTLLLAACATARAPDASVKRIALTFDDAPRDDGPMFTGDERANGV